MKSIEKSSNVWPSLIMLVLTMIMANYQPAGAAGLPKFYLTQEFTLKGSQALNACATGYHMASLFEILDVSNLRYNTTLGFVSNDSGLGPPAGNPLGPPSQRAVGWVRTGAQQSTFAQPGLANCLSWTSDLQEHFGTVVFLPGPDPSWEEPASVVSPWIVRAEECFALERVWCVQN
jgi:hypothetical protein